MAWVALISMVASLLNWGLSLVFGGLLVRALARRTDLRMDYRAAGAAAYLKKEIAHWGQVVRDNKIEAPSN